MIFFLLSYICQCGGERKLAETKFDLKLNKFLRIPLFFPYIYVFNVLFLMRDITPNNLSAHYYYHRNTLCNRLKIDTCFLRLTCIYKFCKACHQKVQRVVLKTEHQSQTIIWAIKLACLLCRFSSVTESSQQSTH